MRDILKAQVGGPLAFPKYIKNMDGYYVNDQDKIQDLSEKAYQQFLTVLYLENTDQTRYGSLVSGLSSQYALGNDQYPKVITTAYNVLSNHKFDQAYHDNKKHHRDQ